MRIDWSTNPQSTHPYVGSRMYTKPVANLQQCTHIIKEKIQILTILLISY